MAVHFPLNCRRRQWARSCHHRGSALLLPALPDIQRQPIYRILGAYRDKLPTYASSHTKASSGEFVEEALEYKERGFQGYKLHVLGEPKFDIQCCTAVRKAVGEDYNLMVDVVSGYNQREALRVGRALEELDFCWYEEPLRDYDIHGYRMLADALDIPICGVQVNDGAGLGYEVDWDGIENTTIAEFK